MKFKLRAFLIENAVPIIFIILLAFAIPASGLSGKFLLQEILTRFGRNAFLVIVLILPMIASKGLNFSMLLGAIAGVMAGQIGHFYSTNWGITGIPGIMLAALISLPIAILLGCLCSFVMNRAKGNATQAVFIIMVLLMSDAYRLFMQNVTGRFHVVQQHIKTTLPLNIFGLNVPVFNYLLIAIVSVFIIWFRKTKLGQDIQAVGQDRVMAGAAGITDNRTRIIAIIITTLLAGFGQTIYLQDLSYMAAVSNWQATLGSIAALFVGGAYVTKASIPNAILGVILLNLMILVTRTVSMNFTGSAHLGEYFMLFIYSGAILYALARKTKVVL